MSVLAQGIAGNIPSLNRTHYSNMDTLEVLEESQPQKKLPSPNNMPSHSSYEPV